MNNPINTIDPNGQLPCTILIDGEYCARNPSVPGASGSGGGEAPNLDDYQVTVDPNQWDSEQQTIMLAGIDLMAHKLWSSYFGYCNQNRLSCAYHNRIELYIAIFGAMTISRGVSDEFSAFAEGHRITVYSPYGYPLSGNNIGLLTHEFGHVFTYRLDFAPANTLRSTSLEADGIIFQQGGSNFARNERGYQGNHKPFVYHKVGDSTDGPSEDFADEFYNWVYNGVQEGPNTLGFSDDSYGYARYAWINDRIGAWVYQAAGH